MNRSIGKAFLTKGALHEQVRQLLMLERLCTRFHLVVMQLEKRYGNRSPLRVLDDYDVQDLLRALLSLEHADVERTEWTPSYAEGKPRESFYLKSNQIAIEVKMAQSGFGVRELMEQIPVDVQRHKQNPDCRTLVCFVYDPGGRMDNPSVLENELNGDDNGLAVRVIIAPKVV